MKKKYAWALFATALMFLGTLQAFAVDYTISFTGSGKSTTVGSIEVQNLTQGTKVTVAGGDVLVLNVIVTGLNPLASFKDGLRISSTSLSGRSNVSFFAKQAGNTQINVYGIDGRKILGSSSNLHKGDNSFQLSLPAGAYVINVRGTTFSYSGKLISVGSSNSRPEIAFVGFEEKEPLNQLKSSDASTMMDYHPGDILLYKGISGNYATIVTDKPTDSKTVNFNFIECKDASGNYYATVKIGGQIWMAENLKTTKYRTGAGIQNITDPNAWKDPLVTGAWCNLDNNTANDAKFGKLYNWYAVSDSRNIAPSGWHVPTVAEYRAMTIFLGDSTTAGGELKETGTTNWQTTVEGTTNETGFSARGSAKCNSSGVMNDYDYAYLWTASEFSATNSTCVFMMGGGIELTMTYSPGKRNGYALRCVLDDQTIRSLSFYSDAQGGTDQWDFSYDPTSNQITQFINYWDGGLDKTVTYDYSVPGKLDLAKDGTSGWKQYDINANGNITKDNISGDEYEYDVNGFLYKTYETWSGSPVLHKLITVTGGNITNITTYDDDGVTAKEIREFTYTSVDNTAGIPQAHVNDVEYQPIGGFYGKPSAKLVDHLVKWDPRVNPVVKTTYPYAYTYDSRNRVTKVVKTHADATTEEWAYTYGD